VFSSPALRCVQTASAVLRAAKAETSVRIEPGLFENTSAYPLGMPQFVEPELLETAGFPIDLTYRPLFTNEQVDKVIRDNDS
jgi:ubiquitin-associated SH3 domain-containing protein